MITKRLLATIAATCGCLFLTAQPKAWQNAEGVSYGREQARSLVIPFDDENEALSLDGESKYVERVTEWSVNDSSDATTFTANFKRPFIWLDRVVYLYLESISEPYQIKVNGKSVGYNNSSKTPAEFEISKFAVEGKNTLEIIIAKSYSSSLLSAQNSAPKILGDVIVSSPPKIRIRDWSVESFAQVGKAQVELGVVLKTELLNIRGVQLYYNLLAPNGESVIADSRAAKLEMKGEDTVRFVLNIPNVRYWSHEDPNIYTLLLKTKYEGRFLEYVAVKIGVREFHIDPDGSMTLNGYPVTLHLKKLQSIPSDKVEVTKLLTKIKDEGYNAVTVSNSPQLRWFYKLCDQLGLYVIDQADINTSQRGTSRVKGGNPTNDPALEQSYLDRVIAMYYTSQSHPSVVAFSLAENSANGYNLYESYLKLKSIESIRPIIYAAAEGEWNNDPIKLSENSGKVITSPISLSLIDREENRFKVSNSYSVTPMNLTARYTYSKGSKVIVSGEIPLVVEPGKSVEFIVPKELPIEFQEEKKAKKLDMNVKIERPYYSSNDYYYTTPAEKPKQNKVQQIVSDGKEALNIEEPKVVETKEVFFSYQRNHK